jgi:gluconolactonase
MRIAARTSGSPNGAALAADGGFAITQAGAHDLSAFSPYHPDPSEIHAQFYTEPHIPHPVKPGLQRVSPSGEVTYLVDEGFRAPNDLVVARDGTIFFTDPPHLNPAERELLLGRVWAYRPDGTIDLIADKFWYCNGIGLDLKGNPVVVERSGLQRINPDGSKEWVIESMGQGTGDGFSVDAAGRYYVAFNPERGLKVVEDGKVIDFLEVPGGRGTVTNACFGGAEMRDLYVTDAFAGRVLIWENMPTPGLTLSPWPT